jgi:hypothetical protein
VGISPETPWRAVRADTAFWLHDLLSVYFYSPFFFFLFCNLGQPSFRDMQCSESNNSIYPEDRKCLQRKDILSSMTNFFVAYKVKVDGISDDDSDGEDDVRDDHNNDDDDNNNNNNNKGLRGWDEVVGTHHRGIDANIHNNNSIQFVIFMCCINS